MRGRPDAAAISEVIEIDEIEASLPRRLRAIADRPVSERPDQVALIDDDSLDLPRPRQACAGHRQRSRGAGREGWGPHDGHQ